MSLLETILRGYVLDRDGLHGVAHWGRVLENGLRLATLTGADPRVVTLFALFHDARRENDDHDPEHGARGAALAREMRERVEGVEGMRGVTVPEGAGGSLLAALPEDSFQLLITACTLHTSARSHADVTVATCFDADRLDLPRCGIRIDPSRLCTPAARDPSLVRWATSQSIANHAGDGLARLRTLA
jgi:uncharacterized protein